MRHVREIIQLEVSAGISTREIARRLGMAASTVRETLRRFEGAGLAWPLPDEHERRRRWRRRFTPAGAGHQTGPSPPRRAGLGRRCIAN